MTSATDELRNTIIKTLESIIFFKNKNIKPNTLKKDFLK